MRRHQKPAWYAALAACGTLLALPSQAQAQDGDGAGAAAPILQAMGELESRRDAKCHSTACRFENFVFGTPLSDEARQVKVELQKQLVRGAWSAATASALAAGVEQVGLGALAPALATVVRTEAGEDGNLLVTFPGSEPVAISSIRVLQYGSIAYSLRALLAVQQDVIVEGAAPLLPLDDAALERLVTDLDAVTLCALMAADASARSTSATEVDGEVFRAAWRSYVPASGAAAHASPSASASRGDARGILKVLIREKRAAYERYNGLTPEEGGQRFITNVERFYALYDIPPTEEKTRPFLATYNRAMVNFTVQLMQASSAIALGKQHDQIRSDDAAQAVQLLTPHVVDDLEDVHFFPALGAQARVTLEAYDCDSYRDLGMHWGYVALALESPECPDMMPDPFAAEIIAESISQYGVLVLRVAGDVAKQRRTARYLEPKDLQRAVRRIGNRSRQNRDRPVSAAEPTHIVSAATNTPRAEGAFFTDVTAAAGIDFRHRSSVWLSEFRRERTAGPPTFSGGGVAAEDLDGDGRPELLFVGGRGKTLYRNDGSGKFSDVTAASGLGAASGEARMPIFADLDNDGRADILITHVNAANRVYRNLGKLVFEDRTEQAGLGGAGLVAGPATVFDYDGDGLLDVYVGYFGNYLEGEVPTVERDNRNGLPNQLFRNLGGLRFENVTAASGTGDTGWCQALSHTDFDRDGHQDIVVANDFGRNAFLRSQGDGTFVNVAQDLGITEAYHSMNVGVGDLNGDDFPDVYISNIATMVKDNKYVLPDVSTPLDFNYKAMATMLVKESDVFYMSRVDAGALTGYEPSQDIERGATSTGWAWDAEFLDFDNDGDDDLYVVNGTNDYNYYASIHLLEDEQGEVAHLYLSHARESNVFFVNEGGKLRNRSAESGADLLLNSRSAVYLDMDGDGDLDIAINNFHSPAVLLQNETPVAGSWAEIQLIGDPERSTNRDAIGARLVVTTAAGVRLSREVQGGSGYFSSNPKAQHVGLGPAEIFDLRVVWPDGSEQFFEELAAGRRYTLRQGGDPEAR